MALTHELAQSEAEAIAATCNEAVGLLARIDRVLEHNSDLSIDWTAGSTPAYLTEDPDGNLAGLTFSRQAVGNAIGSLDAVRSLLTGGSPSTGDHLGNLNLLARPT